MAQPVLDTDQARRTPDRRPWPGRAPSFAADDTFLTGTPDDATGGADRRALAELIRRTCPETPVDVSGAAADAVLAAGWRPPAPMLSTVDELDALAPGAVVTDRDGEPWTRNASGECCQAQRVGIWPDELLEWAPLTRHTDGVARPAAGSHIHA
jgi:hypothetical protein